MKTSSNCLLLSLCASSVLHGAQAFSSPIQKFQARTFTSTALQMSDGASGGIERIEFKIFPDGRIEETVKGVKGNNCHKITEDINAALGEVVATRPTEEMYEQELRVSNTVEVKDENEGDWSSGSSW